jgi:hypothetical protein
MPQTKPSPESDRLVTELLNLAETSATNGALAGSHEVLRIAGQHTDATSMNAVRDWLAHQTDKMPDDEPGRNKKSAIAQVLGLVQGTLASSREARFKKGAEAMDMKRASLTQVKPNGYFRLKKLASEFATVIESTPITKTAVIPTSEHAQPPESDGIVLPTPQEAYEATIDEINAIRGDRTVTVSVASLRSSFDARIKRAESKYPPHVEALLDALEAHVTEGGHVRRIVALTNLAHLQIECDRQARLRERCDTAFYELRAYLLDITPGLAPLVVEGRCGFLGMSDPAAVGVFKACIFRSAAGIDLCARTFDGLWNDRRARWLASSGQGILPSEIAVLRQDIKKLQRRRQAERAPH